MDSYYNGYRFATNYFGLGNETKRSHDLDFYGLRQEALQLYPALQLRLSGKLIKLRLGPKLFFTELRQKPLPYQEAVGANADDFKGSWLAGPRLEFSWDGRNSSMFPTQGGSFELYAGWTNNLNNGNDALIQGAQLNFYLPIDRKQRLVLANRVGYGLIRGQYEFFQAPSLGEQSTALGEQGSLRGYPFDRFRGDTKFYHNIDLRWRIFGYNNSVIPLSVGIYGGFDYGRVWLSSQSSDVWHTAYGGGLWLAPLDFLVFSAGYFTSPEDQRFYFGMGFPF